MDGACFFSTMSFVISNFLRPRIEGASNIVSSSSFSTMERRPRAPVFCVKARSAIASIASGVKSRSKSSKAKDARNCFIIAFFGSVRMRTKSSFVSSLRATLIGKRPISSGIRPNFTKSSGLVWFKSSQRCSSENASTSAPKPIVCW